MTKRIIRAGLLFSVFVLGFLNSSTGQPGLQSTDQASDDIYSVNYWVTPGIIALGAAGNLIGQPRLGQRTDLGFSRIDRLDASRVPAFDRVALRQDAEDAARARKTSDRFLRLSPFLPVLLYLDGAVRKDALDVFLVYAESQLVVSNVYIWTFLGPTFIERVRPVVYYDEVPIEERSWGGNRNSWYSGHVSTVATATFFMAKTLTDIHPELGWKKWLVYGAATLPPVYMGLKRIEALKHFPSDVIAGFVVGAAGGVLIPALHRTHQGKANAVKVNVLYEPDIKWVGLTLAF